MNTSFELSISYRQVCVFDAHLAAPFNDWSESHVAQGFSWRPGSVSFATVEEDGRIRVNVTSIGFTDLAASSAELIISVPFQVPAHGELVIGSIADEQAVQLPAGEYELVFEHGSTGGDDVWVTFRFVAVGAPVTPRILRANASLKPPVEFTMVARPA